MSSAEARAAAAAAEEAADEAPYDPFAAAEESDAEAEEGAGNVRHRRRVNGKPHTRLLSLFNTLGPADLYQYFLLQLPDDWNSTTVQKRLVTRQVQELQQFIVTRPEKTNNTYWPLEEKLLPIIAEFYEQGLYQPVEIITEDCITCKAYLLTSEIATDILQMMLNSSDVLSQIQALAAEAGDGADPEDEGEGADGDPAGMSAAEARTMADAAAYGSDSYRAGERVYILSDSLQSEGDSVQPPRPLARGIIKGPAQAGTEECVFYEVDHITLLDEELFDTQTVWLEDPDRGVLLEETTLRDVWEQYGYITVPTTNIKAAAGSQSGPRLNNMSKSKLNSMRKQELLDLCTSLSLDVDDCKVKADYVNKVLEFQEQQRSMSSEASTTDTAAALKAPRLSRFSMKNLLNAMTDLQRTQHMLLGPKTPYLNVRGGVRMQAFLGVFKRAAATATRRSLCDRQAGSLAVRPSRSHFMRMSQNWWWQGTVAGLRDRAMFLEQLYTAGRGGDMRELELADRFTYTYHTRPREATAILSIQQNGKTNQNGQLMYQGVVRNKDPRVCAIAAVGMFAMSLYSIMGQKFPDILGEDRSWYQHPVYPNFTSGGKMNYEEHRAATRRGLDAVDITKSGSTQEARKAGAQNVLDMGGTKAMAEALAKWNLRQADFSYLNGPDSNAMILQGGHRNIDSYHVNWSHLPPPVECLEKMFVTKDGLSIQEVILQLTERNQDPATRLQTPLGVAMHFLEIGTAALQALPILMHDPDFGSSHPLLNHPAVNCPAFKEYAERQYAYVTRVESVERVITPGTGHETAVSILNSRGMFDSILQRARGVYASMTATATAEGFESFPAWCGAAAAAAAAGSAPGNAATAAVAGSAPGNAAAAATAGSAPGNTAAGRAAGTAAGSAAAGTAASTAAGTAAGSTAAGSTAADTAAGTSVGDAAAGMAAGYAAGNDATPTNTAAGTAAVGSRRGRRASGVATGTHAAAGVSHRASSTGSDSTAAADGAQAAASAADTAAAAAAAAAAATGGQPQGTWQEQARAAGWLPPNMPAANEQDAGLAAEVALLTGVMLSVALKVDVMESLVQESVLHNSTSGLHARQPRSSEPGGVSDGGQQQRQQQQQPQASSSGSGGAQSAAAAAEAEQLFEYEQFGIKASYVGSFPKLLHLFDRGWPVAEEGSPLPLLTYQPLSKSKFKGNDKAQRNQWDNLKQGYKLVKGLSETRNISRKQAADVVEAWRLGSAAAYVLSDGTVTANAASATADGSQCFENMLGNTKAVGLDAALKIARGLDLVKQSKNPKRAAAGRVGSAASARAKRLRRAAAAAAATDQ